MLSIKAQNLGQANQSNVHFEIQQRDQPGSGSAFKLVVTKLEGKSPTPLWFSPFHQFGSLENKSIKQEQ